MADIDHLAWRTSTRSSNGEKCVEVAPVPDGVIIRHSKNLAAGTIAFSHDAWSEFIRDARDAKSASANGCATLTKLGSSTRVTSLDSSVELVFDAGEWAAFVGGADDGEFDFVVPSAAAMTVQGRPVTN